MNYCTVISSTINTDSVKKKRNTSKFKEAQEQEVLYDKGADTH